jgi:uncharacterized membrane protein YccC
VLLTLGRGIVTDDPDAHRRIDRAIDAMAADLGVLPANAPIRTVVDRITERLRIAHNLSVPANFAPGADITGRPMPFWPQLIRPLSANLNWRSPALRHALRTAVTAALPLAFTMFFFTPYDHWLTITVVATGGMIAAGVGLVCTTPLAIAAAMFPLAMLAFAVRAVSFGLFMMALTPLVVLLVESGAPDTGEWTIAFARAALTTIGGLIAVGANFLLWPSREPDLVAAEVKQAIAAHGAYAEADFSALLGETTGISLDQVRRAAGVTTNALEALITRALLEPGNKQQDPLEAAMVVDAALRRCAGRLATLQHDAGLTADVPADTLRLWRDWIGNSMRLLASGQTQLAPRPSGTENAALARIARQIELMSGAMERLR